LALCYIGAPNDAAANNVGPPIEGAKDYGALSVVVVNDVGAAQFIIII
jgi:hypothetical protein